MDYHFNKSVIVPYDTMLRWTADIFASLGQDETDAALCADTLVAADARGVYSHGCMRTPIYSRHMLTGGIDPKAKPELTGQKGAMLMVEGHNAMGQVVSHFAMERTIEAAREYGCASVSIRGSNHFGSCAYYAMQASGADMIGYVGTIGAVLNMAPWGGMIPQLGNNPFGFAAPCLTKPDIVLDMALSVVARGKVVMARKTNSPIPITWALDKDGLPTTDPEAAYWGTMRPVGDYKGYGISYANAIISAILSNASFGDEVTDLYEEPEKVQNCGHFFHVVDISSVTDVTEFKKRMDQSVEYLKGGKKAPGVEEIFVPGEIEARTYQRQRAEGIVYPEEVIEDNAALSRRLGISVPSF